MANSTSLAIRPLGQLVASLSRYGQQLYQPPKDTIRGVEPDTWYSPLQPVKPIGPPGIEPRGFQYYAGQNLFWTPRADAEYCLSPETRVLKADLSWIAVSELRVGDALVGFEEESTGGHPRSYKKSIVTSIGIANLPCHDLIFEDGSRVRASDKHLWLAKRQQASKLEWIATKDLSPVKKNDSFIRVLKPLEPWRFDDSRDAGYLAAAFDGEGHLRKNIRMGFAQKSNAMLNAVIGFLGDRNFNSTVKRRSLWDVTELEILGREEVLRFLGSIRPLRLLSKFDPDNLGELRSRNSVAIRLKTPVGNQRVITIGTSTKTLIAEGFASHNSAADLKQLATYPLARIAIENVKDSMCMANWKIQPKPAPGESPKAAMKRGIGDKNLVKLNRLFEMPDREHTWPEWLRPLLEDMLVIDAWTILIRKTFSGEVVELPVLRGDSIVRYIDENGWTPMAPEPAYAQLWWGLPLVNLSTDQLIYKPRNIVPRNTISSQLYGMSPTEELAREIQIGMKRLEFTLAYYTEGSIPGVVQVVPKGIPVEKIAEAMQWMNSELAGNLAKRRQWQLIQGWKDDGKDEQIIFSKEQLLADPFDELHIRKVAYGYGISPQRLARQMNRASAEASQEASEVEGLMPYFSSLKSLIDFIVQRKMGYADYEMMLEPLVEPDQVKQSQVLTAYVKEAIITREEAREKLGEEPSGVPEAGQLMVTTGQGAVPLGATTQPAAKPGEEGAADGIPDKGKGGAGASGSDEELDADGNLVVADGRGKPRKPASTNKPNGGAAAKAKTQNRPIGFAAGTVIVEHESPQYGVLEIHEEALVKAKPRAKDPPVIHPGRMAPASILGKHKLERDLTKIFRTMHRKTTKVMAAALGLAHGHLAKAEPDADMTLRQAMDSLAAEWETIARLARKPLTDAALAGASKGSLELEISAEDMLTGINETARDWASNRAAELVGMLRTPEGELIANPNAKWAISDTTREKLRSVIADVFGQEGKITLRDVENRIEQSGVFSDVRASTIARNEIARAQTQGNLMSWQESGLVQKVAWKTSDDHDQSDICDELEKDGPYDVDDVPDLPAHPNCLCALILTEAEEQ